MLIAPLILAISVIFLPDTPRWFVHRGRLDDAHRAMRKLRGPTWPEEDISKEIQEVVAMDRIETELEGSGDYPQCFKGTDGRRTRITILVLIVQAVRSWPFGPGHPDLCIFNLTIIVVDRNQFHHSLWNLLLLYQQHQKPFHHHSDHQRLWFGWIGERIPTSEDFRSQTTSDYWWSGM